MSGSGLGGPLLAAPGGTTVTVGSFDGVHRGHRAVLDALAARAAAVGRMSVLVTFEPHPLEVVNPSQAPLRLSTDVERVELLAESPVEGVVVLRFDRALAALPPEAFVREILIARCGMRDLVMGHDHGFGRGRSGDVEMLRALGTTDGFGVDVVPPALVGGEPVSSTRIRDLIAAGDLSRAAGLLGRPYRVSGRVTAGEQRGRILGVPTINLGELPDRKLLPPDGVYAVRVEWRGGCVGGMMNQGPRPTFGDARRVLEAHLFGFEGDLYGEWVRIEWVERLRDVRRFGSADELIEQLQRDRMRAHEALDIPPTNPSRV